MLDRKISSKELERKGLIIDEIEIIPPNTLKEKTQANLRYERRIPFFKLCGRIYYQASHLKEWAEKQKINAAS